MGKSLAWVLLAMTACGGSDPGSRVDAPTSDVGNVPGQPGLGANELVFYRLFESQSTTLATPAMTTAPTGSTFVVSVGRGDINAHAVPTDNKGNTAVQLGDRHNYQKWLDSGTALYAFTGMTGGSDHVVRATTPAEDEITFTAVEVINGTRIQAFEHVEVPTARTHTSRSVTTTGPATLVAFWWGDANVDGDKNAIPGNGFTLVKSLFREGALVQSAVAVRNVAAAGTYEAIWTNVEPEQGAQLWLVAVE